MAKILIIEDDPLIVKIYSTRLKADGYEVFSGENGEEGLKVAYEKHPDLIILDVMMPKVDGFEVLSKLRADQIFATIPILMYSNLNNEEEMKRARNMGVTEFLVKANLSPTQMVTKIKQYLEKTGASPTGQPQ
jgi:DNA-binding response OmpR family regulator